MIFDIPHINRPVLVPALGGEGHDVRVSLRLGRRQRGAEVTVQDARAILRCCVRMEHSRTCCPTSYAERL